MSGAVPETVGAGGHDRIAGLHRPVTASRPQPCRGRGSQVRNTGTFGILELRLAPGRYSWRFRPEPGKTFSDHGSGRCH